MNWEMGEQGVIIYRWIEGGGEGEGEGMGRGRGEVRESTHRTEYEFRGAEGKSRGDVGQ